MSGQGTETRPCTRTQQSKEGRARTSFQGPSQAFRFCLLFVSAGKKPCMLTIRTSRLEVTFFLCLRGKSSSCGQPLSTILHHCTTLQQSHFYTYIYIIYIYTFCHGMSGSYETCQLCNCMLSPQPFCQATSRATVYRELTCRRSNRVIAKLLLRSKLTLL